jgi:hypothetical protein
MNQINPEDVEGTEIQFSYDVNGRGRYDTRKVSNVKKYVEDAHPAVCQHFENGKIPMFSGEIFFKRKTQIVTIPEWAIKKNCQWTMEQPELDVRKSVGITDEEVATLRKLIDEQR